MFSENPEHSLFLGGTAFAREDRGPGGASRLAVQDARDRPASICMRASEPNRMSFEAFLICCICAKEAAAAVLPLRAAAAADEASIFRSES